MHQDVLHVSETVRADTLAYRARVEAFRRGEVWEGAARAERASMGIYEHRTPGRYMVRVRIGAGRVLPGQLRCIAALGKKYGDGVLHVTTRQDFQIHGVAIEHTPDVVEALLAEGLSSRGGGGNTVRNISACPRAGVCPNEPFDVSSWAIAAADHLLQHESSFNLPRKFKVAFSGCSNDCALASVADVGFFAETRDGRHGFRVYAGGGLGRNARGGVEIEAFVPAEECIAVTAAVLRVFNRHGDRANRHRARLRYVLANLGEEGFKEEYIREKAPTATDETRLKACGQAESRNGHGLLETKPNVLPENRPGLFSLRLRLPLGDIPADDLLKVSRIADRLGDGVVRTSQLQDLLLTGLTEDDLAQAQAALTELSICVSGQGTPKMVTCVGASTCKLGVCLSRGLAVAISAALERQGTLPAGQTPLVRISGCPNSCGGHQIAEIGLEGRIVRVGGSPMPCYAVYAGARLSAAGAQLGDLLGVVPARRVPEMLAKAFKRGTTDREGLRTVVSEFERMPDEIPPDWYRDYETR